jgi:hypothetical protein
MLLAVKADSPLQTLQDVVTAARKDPGKLNFGAINPGSTQNLSAHLMKQVSGLDVTIIPYKTTPELITGILRSDVDVGFDYYAALQPVIIDNKVRIVATSGEERNPLLHNVPTARESGFPEYLVTSWNGLASAAGLPTDVLAALNGHINAALSDPALRATATKLGMDARGSTPEQMRDRMADIKKWAAENSSAWNERRNQSIAALPYEDACPGRCAAWSESGMMRCKPGTVTHTAFATVPDQRRTASLSLALHRIRDTSDLILAPMGSSPRATLVAGGLVRACTSLNRTAPVQVP